ncbi:putative glycosyltransferase [Rhizobium sp. PP-F2F-G36]|nr:putative glycosyltransferase [Rhizobium sp. PP-F2F-G36]
MTDPDTKRVLFYVQHLLGIGHLTRASRIANALAVRGFDVTVVTGGKPVSGFPGPAVRHIALPPVVSSDEGFSALQDMDGNPVDDAFRDMRRDRLVAILHEIKPHAILTEAFPFGRRQMRFELLPFLDAARAMPEPPKIFASVRDILQKRPKPERDRETVDYIERYFDRILIHGDPTFARLEETFPHADEIADKVVYTGLVAPPQPDAPADRFEVIVSAGGGAVGRHVLHAVVGATAILRPEKPWALITGPNLAQADHDAIAAGVVGNVEVFRFRPDFASLLSGATLSVSQAGYNTVCDILRARCRAIVVPFTTGGETEQAARAERLERLGLVTVLSDSDISAERVAAAIRSGLDAPAFQQGDLSIDLEGADRTADILRDMLSDA